MRWNPYFHYMEVRCSTFKIKLLLSLKYVQRLGDGPPVVSDGSST